MSTFWQTRFAKPLQSQIDINVQHLGMFRKFFRISYDTVRKSCAQCDQKVATTDVGQHQMWAAQYYKYSRPRTFLSSGGLGTMGYGLGACIGAKVGSIR